MADIELVIKIPEEIYESRYGEECDEKDCLIIDAFTSAIINGTPLPKGHGKLFDENELKKEAVRCEWSRNMYDTLDRTLSYMKPIIEADTPKRRKGTPLEENDSGYNCENWIP